MDFVKVYLICNNTYVYAKVENEKVQKSRN